MAGKKGQASKKVRVPKTIRAYAPFAIGCAANPRPRQKITPVRRIFQFDHDVTQNPQYVNCSNLLHEQFNTDRYTGVMIHSIRVWTQSTSNNVLQSLGIKVVVPGDRPNPISSFFDQSERMGDSARLGIAIPNTMLSQYKRTESFMHMTTTTCAKVLIEVDATVA